jgi:hypothetical protein
MEYISSGDDGVGMGRPGGEAGYITLVGDNGLRLTGDIGWRPAGDIGWRPAGDSECSWPKGGARLDVQ